MKIKTNTTLNAGEPTRAPAVPVEAPDADTSPIDVDEPDTPYPMGEDPHMGWKRDELDAYARELGVKNPEDAQNKGAVLALIEAV